MTITLPDGSTQPVDLALVSPGRYEARVTAPEPGAYGVSLDALDVGMAGAVQVSPEWLPDEGAAALLESLANRSGGIVRSLDQAPDALLFDAAQPEGRAPGTVRAMWFVPLGLALILFVVEIGLRQARLWAPNASPAQPPQPPDDSTA